MHRLDLSLDPFRTLAGVCLIGAPLLMLAADGVALLQQRGGADPSAAGFWAGSILMWLAFDLFVGAVVAMAALAASGARGLAATGLVLGVTGSLIGATIMGMFRVAWSMELRGIGADTVQAAVMEPVVHFTSRVPGLTFPIGLILLAAALARAGVLSKAGATTLGIGALLFPVGRIITGPVANVPGDVLMSVVMVPLGRRVIAGRGTSEEIG